MIASNLIRIPNMTKSHILLAFAAATMTLTSCFKEEPLNAECDIEKAYIHVDEPLDMFVKKTDTLATTDQTANVVTFSVRKGTDRTAVAPLFQITPGATISPENGSTQDFSNGGVTYTVTSEDKAWSRTYTVRVNEVADHSPLYDFENFFLEPGRERYYIWTDILKDNPEDENESGTRLLNWASGNAGFAIVAGNKTPDKYPTAPLEEGYKGHGVCLTTRSTGRPGNAFNMPIAAGNIFTGEFYSKSATSKPLEATHFGSGDFCVITKKPLKFSGYYQYTPGETVTNRQKEVLEGVVDKGDIYAVLFRNTIKGENGEDQTFYLDGTNVKTSPQIVAIAEAPEINKTEGGWNRFEVAFNYRSEIDPTVLANRGYSLAIVCTSSIEGANFQGAVGSQLLVDELHVLVDEE